MNEARYDLSDINKILGKDCAELSPEEFIEQWFMHDLDIRDQHILHDFYRVVKFYQEAIRDATDMTCAGCGKYMADSPGGLCPGCEAYQEHQR